MRLRAILKSKIHRATVTGARLDYVGSIAIDEELLEKSDIRPGELVHVWNVNNGERIETYALPAPPGSGSVVLNGAAARRFCVQDVIIVAAFCLTDETVSPRVLLVDEKNAFVRYLTDNHPD